MGISSAKTLGLKMTGVDWTNFNKVMMPRSIMLWFRTFQPNYVHFLLYLRSTSNNSYYPLTYIARSATLYVAQISLVNPFSDHNQLKFILYSFHIFMLPVLLSLLNAKQKLTVYVRMPKAAKRTLPENPMSKPSPIQHGQSN